MKLLEKIAGCLIGIAKADLTKAESQIVTLLQDDGIVSLRESVEWPKKEKPENLTYVCSKCEAIGINPRNHNCLEYKDRQRANA